MAKGGFEGEGGEAGGGRWGQGGVPWEEGGGGRRACCAPAVLRARCGGCAARLPFLRAQRVEQIGRMRPCRGNPSASARVPESARPPASGGGEEPAHLRPRRPRSASALVRISACCGPAPVPAPRTGSGGSPAQGYGRRGSSRSTRPVTVTTKRRRVYRNTVARTSGLEQGDMQRNSLSNYRFCGKRKNSFRDMTHRRPWREQLFMVTDRHEHAFGVTDS